MIDFERVFSGKDGMKEFSSASEKVDLEHVERLAVEADDWTQKGLDLEDAFSLCAILAFQCEATGHFERRFTDRRGDESLTSHIEVDMRSYRTSIPRDESKRTEGDP